MSKPCHCPQAEKPGYIGAIILGLNDALVELTGALAGFTIALQDCRLIFLAGLTTGLAATLSMACAEYLSLQADINGPTPWKAACYTGVAYLVTVALLLLPFVMCSHPVFALLASLAIGAAIITLFSFFEARLRKVPFFRICLQMLIISFGVAAIAFLITWLANFWWGVGL